MSMYGYLLRRLLGTIPVLLVVAVFIFLMLRLTPSDPAAIIAGDNANAEQVAQNLVDAANEAGGRDNITAVFVAGPAFRGRSAATRPRLGVTRIRPRRRVWSGRVAFLSYGLLLGMLLWAVLRIRG